MRVKFRVRIYSKEGKRLSKEDFFKHSDPIYKAMRYVMEFKYLEATKWLMVSRDCMEKYLLLGLLSIALGQEQEGLEFLQEATKHQKLTDYVFAVEKPEEGFKFTIERIQASLPDFLLSL